MRRLFFSETVRRIAWSALFLPALFAARANAGDDGGYAGAFLRLDVGARAAAMGGAFVAVADGPTGFHYNPAGPAWVKDRGAEVSYRRMGFDRQHGAAAVLIPLRQEAAICGSWIHAGVSDVFERDAEGAPGDELANSDNAVAFTFAKRFGPVVSLGTNLRYVQKNIANVNAYTVGFDFGLLVRVPRSAVMIGGSNGVTDLRLGLAVERINYKFPWNTQDFWVRSGETGQSFEERWPINIRTGMAVSAFEKRANLALDVEVNQESGPVFHGGLEILPHSALALRGGINGAHLAAGVGVRAPFGKTSLVVDYAFAATDAYIDDEHIISIGVRF